MGRAALRTADPASGRSGQSPRKIGQVRRKRKKRKKELEELRRDVLEAKRNLRLKAQPHKTWKTAFAKVLTNFADKRRENEEGNRAVIGAGKCGKRTKPRTICDRLLPELVGMYKNGAKGREILRARECRNETNATARLRGDVLKLLNGDETNPKSTREQRGENEARRETRFPTVGSSDESDADESDCEIENGRIVKANRARRTKGVVKKLANRESKRRKERENDETSEAKDQLTERVVHRQRDEDKCRRRLFEPDDGVDENSFGIIDRTGGITDEIRFSPSRRVSGVLLADKLKKTKDSNEKSAESLEKTSGNDRNKKESKGVAKFSTTNDNHWGWSPSSCYENLCAMTCVENFEDNHRRYKVPDRSLKIRKILRGFYLEKVRQSRSNPPDGSKTKSPFSRQMDQSVSTDDPTVKVGSWHAKHFTRSCDREDSKIFQDNKTTRNGKKSDESPPINNNGGDSRSTNDTVWKTIDSVSRFLETFEQCDSSTGKDDSFAERIAQASANPDEEKLDDLDVATRDLTFDENRKILVRRNTRHVPTILRRTNCRPGLEETKSEKPPRRDEKRRGSSDVSTLLADSISASSISSTKDNSILSLFSVSTLKTPRATPVAKDEKAFDNDGVKITRNLKLKFIGRNYESNGNKVVENKPANFDSSIYRNQGEADNGRKNVPIHRRTNGKNVTFSEWNENLVPHYRCDNRESSSRLVSEFPAGIIEDLNENLCQHRHHRKTKESVDEILMEKLNEPISRFSSLNPRTLFAHAELQNRPSQSRSFQSLETFRANEDPIVKSELADQGRPRPPEQRPVVKRPVVLFRPNVEKSRTSNPRFHENVESIAIRDAVRNLRATIFQENGQELVNKADHRRYQEQQQPRQTPACDFHPSQNRAASREDEIFAVNQPSKFVALERTNGTNPRRAPIFINGDRPSLPIVASNNEHRGSTTEILTIVDDQSDPDGMIYVRSHERPDNSRERGTTNAQLARHTQHLDPSRTYRVSGYRQPCNYYSNENDALLVAHLPPANFHPVADNVFSTTAPNNRAWSNEASRISDVTIDRQRLTAVRPSRTMYERVESASRPVRVPTSVYTHNPPARYEIDANLSRNYHEGNESLPKRVRLSDGRIGLVVDNDLSERLDIDPRLDSNLARVDGSDEKIFSRPAYRWNPVYKADEEYPPHLLA